MISSLPPSPLQINIPASSKSPPVLTMSLSISLDFFPWSLHCHFKLIYVDSQQNLSVLFFPLFNLHSNLPQGPFLFLFEWVTTVNLFFSWSLNLWICHINLTITSKIPEFTSYNFLNIKSLRVVCSMHLWVLLSLALGDMLSPTHLMSLDEPLNLSSKIKNKGRTRWSLRSLLGLKFWLT